MSVKVGRSLGSNKLFWSSVQPSGRGSPWPAPSCRRAEPVPSLPGQDRRWQSVPLGSTQPTSRYPSPGGCTIWQRCSVGEQGGKVSPGPLLPLYRGCLSCRGALG